jgi:hypothetical protein
MAGGSGAFGYRFHLLIFSGTRIGWSRPARGLIVSPADGKVIKVEPVDQTALF